MIFDLLKKKKTFCGGLSYINLSFWKGLEHEEGMDTKGIYHLVLNDLALFHLEILPMSYS